MKKKKLNILFRTSGGRAKGKELGLGHVYRCLNLANQLNFEKIFFLLEDYGGAEKVFLKNGYKNIKKIKKNIPIQLDIENSIKNVKEKNIDVLIIDKYNLSVSYVKKLQKYTKVVVISDLKRIDFPGDLVVNGFIGYPNAIRKNRYDVETLTGVKYMIINEKFKKIKRSQKKFGLVTTFGGFDEHGISDIVIKEIMRLKPDFKTKIILGPATKKIKKLSLNESRYLTIVKKTNDMRKEISTAKRGLCSGGITSYEFASQKIPFGIICQEKHQLMTANEWEKKKIAVNLGLINSETHKKLRKFLEGISSKKIIPSKKIICDAKGAERVAKKILSI